MRSNWKTITLDLVDEGSWKSVDTGQIVEVDVTSEAVTSPGRLAADPFAAPEFTRELEEIEALLRRTNSALEEPVQVSVTVVSEVSDVSPAWATPLTGAGIEPQDPTRLIRAFTPLWKPRPHWPRAVLAALIVAVSMASTTEDVATTSKAAAHSATEASTMLASKALLAYMALAIER